MPAPGHPLHGARVNRTGCREHEAPVYPRTILSTEISGRSVILKGYSQTRAWIPIARSALRMKLSRFSPDFVIQGLRCGAFTSGEEGSAYHHAISPGRRNTFRDRFPDDFFTTAPGHLFGRPKADIRTEGRQPEQTGMRCAGCPGRPTSPCLRLR